MVTVTHRSCVCASVSTVIDDITQQLFSDAPGDTLYHYTSLSGLLGIVDTPLLSQWRGYSVHGKGVSRGFASQNIRQCVDRQRQ